MDIVKRLYGRFREGKTRDGSIVIQPHVTALVEIPRLGVSQPVDFLVDTGANRTAVHPYTMVRMNVDPMTYQPAAEDDIRRISGVGGTSRYGQETVVIHLRDDSVELPILMGPLDGRLVSSALQTGMPSLLGMDVLSRTRLSVDYVANRMSLELHPASAIRDLWRRRSAMSTQEFMRYREKQHTRNQ